MKTEKASRKELGYRGPLGGDWDQSEEDNDTDGGLGSDGEARWTRT